MARSFVEAAEAYAAGQKMEWEAMRARVVAAEAERDALRGRGDELARLARGALHGTVHSGELLLAIGEWESAASVSKEEARDGE